MTDGNLHVFLHELELLFRNNCRIPARDLGWRGMTITRRCTDSDSIQFEPDWQRLFNEFIRLVLNIELKKLIRGIAQKKL